MANADFRYNDWYTQCAHVVAKANGGGRDNGFTVGQFAKAIDERIDMYRAGRKLSAALQAAGFERLRSHGVTTYFVRGETLHNDNGLLAIRGLTRSSATIKAVVGHWADQ